MTPSEYLTDVEKPIDASLTHELRRWWITQPAKALFIGLFAAWCLLFHFLGNSTYGYIDTHSLFGWMFHVFTHSPDDDYCLYIPLVVLVLLGWKRRELIAVLKMIWWPALALVLLGLLFHVAGFMVQQARVSIIGFFLGLYGLTGLVWGRAWLKATFFPMFLFVFCIPFGTMADVITLPLRKVVTFLSVGIGRGLLGIEVFQNGSQILDGGGRPLYDVAPACSGIRSLISLFALATIYSFMSFQSSWQRLVVILTAIPLAVAGNVLRISTVIVVGELFGVRAGTLIEQKLGFLTFAVAVMGLMGLKYLLQRPKRPEKAMPKLQENPA